MLYHGLDATSVAQHLAFHTLYPQTQEGKQALSHAWQLLGGAGKEASLEGCLNTAPLVQALIALVNKQPGDSLPALSSDELAALENLGSSFPNRRLKGYQAQQESDILALPAEEIDLARGILLAQLGAQDKNLQRGYEALIDLMALQIRARLPENAMPLDKIRLINQFLFEELEFHFPPHSLFAKDIDTYTFLPSVLDSRKGVCLGVSVLYLCIAQRLNLPLEMVTPPGHIYVRYRDGDRHINIETTARGIHLDSEEYLSINTHCLQERNIKEVIGFTYVNEASVYSQRGEYARAIEIYKKALPYLPEDFLVQEMLGFHYLLAGQKEEGIALLKTLCGRKSIDTIAADVLLEDVLKEEGDTQGLQAILLAVDETRESVLRKKDALKAAAEKFPQFREVLFSLAVTWIQLHRNREALEVLSRYHQWDPTHPVVEYYLTLLHLECLDYPNAWKHFHQLGSILQKAGYKPKLLKELRRTLCLTAPI
jgi:regulator of sirC expression with transglutaminase-like and TPR domain